MHLIGQSKWAISAEGYNHLNGFYESFDGGLTWPVQGHVPGYEGWTDNTDPVGAFDPWGNFYSLVLPYQFYYDKHGFKKYDNGSNQTNPTVPPEAIAVSVQPAGLRRRERLDHDARRASRLRRHRQEREHERSRQAVDRDRYESRQPALRAGLRDVDGLRDQPVRPLRSHADARPDGTHTDWSARRSCRPSRASAGTRTSCRTSRPTGRSRRRSRTTRSSRASPPTTSTSSGRRTAATRWQGPLPVVQDVVTPTYQNTTFREGIVNTFAVGTTPVAAGDPVPALRVLRGRLERSLERLPDGLLRRRPYMVDADPGERQRGPDGGASAQPARGAERHGGGRRSTTGGSPARRAGAPTSPARASPSTRARTAASRTTASTRRSSSTSRT